MKKGFTVYGLLAVLMVLVVLMVPLQSAQAQTPVEKVFTIGTNATYASTNYTTGIHTAVFSSFKPLVVDMTLFASNATVSLKRAATGSAYWSYTFAANSTSTVQFVTNDFYFLRGDTITVSVGSVNVGGSVKLQGLEQ